MFKLIYQSIYLALGQIWANKMRSILTTLGIVIGVASVTAVIAALSGLKAKILKDFETVGANTIQIYSRRPNTGPMRYASGWQLRLKPEQFEDILEHCPSVSLITRVATLTGEPVKAGDRSVDNAYIVGIDAGYHEIEDLPVLLGREFSIIDDAQGANVCIIDPKLQKKLNLNKDCIGDELRLGHRVFRIVGLVEERPMGLFSGMMGDQYYIYIPFKTLQKMTDVSMTVYVASKSAEVVDEAMAEIKFFLRKTRQIKPGEPDTFGIESLKNILDIFNAVAMAVTLVAGGIVGISLLVGGIGIMNIMLVSVSERTREIGLRKAVGARSSAILAQFLIEALVLCFFGGLIGLLFGQLMTIIIASLSKLPFDMAYIPFWAILLAFGFSGSVGIFFGVFPAVKAARLDPIEALRHE